MAVKQIEIVPCKNCRMVPVFLPLPSSDFPIRFFALCKCKSFIPSFSQDLSQVYKRRAAVNPFIRRWNKRHEVELESNITSAKTVVHAASDSVACKFCGKTGLSWHRRPYKSPYKSVIDFVLYEKVETGLSAINISGHRINAIKYKIHNCLTRKDIVDIKYIKE